MKTLKQKLSDFFQNKDFLVIDTGKNSLDTAFHPFALTDIFLNFAGEQHLPILHFWSMEQMIILGMKDTRIPHLADGLAKINQHDYHYVLRNSGGLAVVADEGILNASLIIPNPEANPLSITNAYEVMFQWMALAFGNQNQAIHALEISNSYCPGDFDLSIDGKKFAGIAQRRIKNGLAIMIYLSITGPQQKRGEVIRDFYTTGLGTHIENSGYPLINPNSMANLTDLLAENQTVSAVKKKLITTLQKNFGAKSKTDTLAQFTETAEFKEQFEQQLIKMQHRNQMLAQLKE